MANFDKVVADGQQLLKAIEIAAATWHKAEEDKKSIEVCWVESVTAFACATAPMAFEAKRAAEEVIRLKREDQERKQQHVCISSSCCET